MLIYGHRGAKGCSPENTLPSFRLCLDSGVTRCELDLQLSADNQLVVVHDPSLKRLTGRKAKVAHKTAEELAQYEVLPGSSTQARCSIPTLQRVIESCAFDRWQLELKPLSRQKTIIAIQEIAKLATQLKLNEMLCITSSSIAALKVAQVFAPDIARGYVAEYTHLDPIKVAVRNGCSLLVLNWELCTLERVRRAKKAGLHVSAWTVNEPELMLELAQRAVDSLITDFPGLANATFGIASTSSQK